MGFEFKLNMTAMEEKKFGAWVTDSTNFPELFNKFALWNRADLRDQLITQLRAHNAAHLIPVPMVVPQERNIGIEEAVQARLVIKRKPLANPRNLIIHRRSVAAFLLASPGNAFSAIAMIGHVKKEQKVVTTKKLESKLQKQIRTELVGRPKIFLCPASQLTKTTGGSSQGYVPKEHINAQTGVYRVSVIGTISHRASDIKLEGTTARIVPGSVASHTQMSELVRAKSKYESLNQRDGHFVGFTVSKGESGGVWKNRYSMTSNSSNTPTFGSPEDQGAFIYYPPLEWTREIMRACDNLLQLEGDVRAEGIDMDAFCQALLRYTVRENILWKTVKRTYWPCQDKSVEFTFVEEEEGWDEDGY